MLNAIQVAEGGIKQQGEIISIPVASTLSDWLSLAVALEPVSGSPVSISSAGGKSPTGARAPAGAGATIVDRVACPSET